MKTKLSWAWFEVGLVVLGLALHLWISLSPVETVLGWYDSDDAFYYYKIAQNITTGQGVTFDGINRTNGFHPLWMVVCLPVFWLARFDLVLPLRLLILVSAAFGLGAGILLFRLLRKYVPVEAAALASVIWCFLPLIHAVVVRGGMETSISAFFLMLLFYLAVQWHSARDWRRLVILGVVAGLVILARLDNIFAVLLLGVWFCLGPTTTYLRTVAAGDLAVIFISGLLSYYLRLDNRYEYIQNAVSLPWLVGLSFVVKPLVFLCLGLYRPEEKEIDGKFIACLVGAGMLASSLVAGILVGLQYSKVYSALPRTVILIDALLTITGVLLVRLFACKIMVQETGDGRLSLRSWDDWRVLFRRALGYYLPAVSMLVAYMAWNHFYIGSAMPVSGQIKRWWGGLNTIYGRPIRSLSELLGVSSWEAVSRPVAALQKSLEASLGQSGAVIITILVVLACLVGIFWLMFPRRMWITRVVDELGLFVIFAGLYAQIISYTSTLYMHIRSWYWSGELLFTVLWIGLLAGLLIERLKRHPVATYVGRILGAVASLACVMSLVIVFYEFSVSEDIHRESRRIFSEVEFLENNTPPDSLIGITGGGTVAYFIADRTVVNLDGLVNSPEYFSLMQENRGAELLDKIGLDYVYGREYKLLNSAPYQSMLTGRMELILELSDVRYLYRYLPAGQ